MRTTRSGTAGEASDGRCVSLPLPVRICLVYDCLFPYTVGGAERWYRNLAERLAADGPRGHVPDAAPVGPRASDGDVPGRARASRSGRGWRSTPTRAARGSCRRSCSALGVLWHLLRHGAPLRRRPHRLVPVLLAAGRGARCGRCGRFRLVVDWHEVWTREYWREYLGRAGGAVGWRRAARCACACRQRAFCFSRLHARRPARGGPARRGDACSRASTPGRSTRASRRAGRAARRVRRPPHPGEARARRSCRAIALARARACPELRGEIYGDGPERAEVLRARSREHGLEDARRGARLRRRRARRARRCARALLHGAALAPRGLRAGRGRGGRARHAERRRARRRTTRRPSWSRRASTASSPRRPPPRTSPPRSCACARPAPALRESHGRLVRAQRAAAVARGVARPRRGEYVSADRRRARSKRGAPNVTSCNWLPSSPAHARSRSHRCRACGR